MIEVLTIVAGSWPITVMVVGVATAIVIRRTFKQAMDNSQAARDLRVSNAVAVRGRDDD